MISLSVVFFWSQEWWIQEAHEPQCLVHQGIQPQTSARHCQVGLFCPLKSPQTPRPLQIALRWFFLVWVACQRWACNPLTGKVLIVVKAHWAQLSVFLLGTWFQSQNILGPTKISLSSWDYWGYWGWCRWWLEESEPIPSDVTIFEVKRQLWG